MSELAAIAALDLVKRFSCGGLRTGKMHPNMQLHIIKCTRLLTEKGAGLVHLRLRVADQGALPARPSVAAAVQLAVADLLPSPDSFPA